jgi:predicted ATPase
LAGNLWLLGYPEQSNRIAEQAHMRAQELAHPFTLTYVGYYDTHRHVVARSAQAAQAASEATIALCREHQVAYWHSLTTICHGWAHGSLGGLADGIAQIHKGIDHRAAEGTWVSEPLYRALLAELYVQAGEVAQAHATLEAGITAAHARGEHWYTADLYRIQGDLLLLQGNAVAGEQALQRALSTARSQHAKSLELRAAISLTRLWHNHGRIQDAQQLLAPLYNWFSEGFDTPDLVAARNLLDMLAN